MSLFGNIAKQTKSNPRGKGTKFSLDQVLVAFSMAQAGVPKETIAAALGCSVHSMNYQIFEKQANFKDGTKCRSVMKHLYVDHTDPDSDTVDGEEFAKRLFEAFGEEYTGEHDIEARIDAWRENNEPKAEGEVIEQEVEAAS